MKLSISLQEENMTTDEPVEPYTEEDEAIELFLYVYAK